MGVWTFYSSILDEVQHYKSFGTIMFGIKQTSTANTRSIRSFSSTALNLSSKAIHLLWSIGPTNLSSNGHSAIKSIIIKV